MCMFRHVSGGESHFDAFHLLCAFTGSKLYLRNVAVRQESAHSERHGIFVGGGVYDLPVKLGGSWRFLTGPLGETTRIKHSYNVANALV